MISLRSNKIGKIQNSIIVYTDGGSRGNPGPAAIGIYIESGPEKIRPPRFYSEYIGEATNNEAEYRAVIFALKKIKLLLGKANILKNKIEIRIDSELVVKQLNGEYKILEKDLQPLFLEIWNLKIDFGEIDFVQIDRSLNKEADKMVNQELDKQKAKLF